MHKRVKGGAMLKIESLSKAFGDNDVLKNVSLCIPSTGVTAIMGASGIGKTTLLNIIAGLEQADSGSIDSTFSRVSYKFQEPRLFDWLTALDNVKAVVSDKQTADRTARDLLSSVGMADSLLKYPPELSGGMKQRVALARALAYDGDLLLLDEPFSAVDAETKALLIDLIRAYGENHAVLLVTHDREEALLLNAEIIELK